MTLSERLSRLDSLQDSRRFKIVATVLAAALAVAVAAAWLILVHAPATRDAVRTTVDAATAAGQEAARARESVQGATDAGALIDAARGSPIVAVLGAIAIASGLATMVIWLGLGLTALALLLVASLVVAPLLVFPATRDAGAIIGGVVALSGAFSILTRGLRAALAGAVPWAAVARNVLAEAVRMKISMVFIVLLMFFLAGLPFFLQDDQPLRYRVQLFLRYGSGGAFWVLALLTIFFSISTVAFEQRDKVIWQTMTKPVPPWQYLFGKWLGVCALNTALLGVAASGVFLFTEHLRGLPAQGEVRPFVSINPAEPSLDRRLLETQVLTARRGQLMNDPTVDKAAIDAEVQRRLRDFQDALAKSPFVIQDAPAEASFRKNVMDEMREQQRSIEPGGSRAFTFENLSYARGLGRPVSLRYRFNSGADNPSNIYRIFFVIGGVLYERQAAINVTQTLDLPADAIDEKGVLTVQVFNGDPNTRGNLREISFAFDGLELLYVAGSYEANFLRVAAVLWLKLAFLAGVGVATATFLSFPVASLVAMGVFFIAETSGFLSESLENYTSKTEEGINYFALVVRLIALPVNWAFRWYGEMNPTESLIDGRMLSWGSLAQGSGLLVGVTAVILTVGAVIFRRRELATYSGK